jgi:NTP pyrophosphatase (non-canonical NTP hydrolase)
MGTLDVLSFQQYAADVRRTAGSKIDFDYHVPAIAGEAGEVAELFKKYKYHDIREFKGKPFLDALQEELGDVLWGIVNCANYFGLDIDSLVRANCNKRSARYPQGFVAGGGIRDENIVCGGHGDYQ